MKFETEMHRQRFRLGIVCGLLPICCLVFGLFGEFRGINYQHWYTSISATYFANSNACMIGALSLCSFFLFTYTGYDLPPDHNKWYHLGDKKLTRISAISAFMVLAFPCSAEGSGEYLGLMALASNISNTIHSIAAATLFTSFALMILTQFTKGTHKRRNVIYHICGTLMIIFILFIGISSMIGLPGYMTMVCEFVILEAFAVAWIIKSGVFPKI